MLALSSVPAYAEETLTTATSSGIETSQIREMVSGAGLESVSGSAVEETDSKVSEEGWSEKEDEESIW